MWFINKYSIFIILFVFCVLSCIQCKEKIKKKSNSIQSVKKNSSLSEKLVKSPKSLILTTNSKTTKSTRSLKSFKKIKTSKNNVLKSAKQTKQTTETSKPIINFSNGLSGRQRDKAIEIVTEVLQNTNKTTDFVECIRKELDRELDLRSNVILSSRPVVEQSLSKASGAVVMQLSVNMTNVKNDKKQVLVSIFGLMKGNELSEKSLNLMKRAQKLTPKIIDSLMSTDMKQEIQKMTTRVVRNAKSLDELSDQLSEVLNDRFGPHWHSVVGHKNMMSVDNHRKSSIFFLNMDFGDMRVSVFK